MIACRRAIAGDSVSGLGTGGMGHQLQAADVACRAGIDTIIAAGSRPGVIGDSDGGVSQAPLPRRESPLEKTANAGFSARRRRAEITADAGDGQHDS